MKILSATLLLSLLLTGCVSTWVKVDDTGRHYQHEHYSSTLPAGWLRIENDEGLVLSKDGVLLQSISILYRPHEKALKNTEKDTSATMLPSELAELTIAEIKAGQEEGVPSLRVASNEPVEIAGRTGFGIHLQYKTTDGLRMEMLLRGVVDENGFYLVKYTAPTLHYFNRDRQVYEAVVTSIKL